MKIERERRERGRDDIDSFGFVGVRCGGDFGTVAILVVARGRGSEEAYDAVAPAVGIYAQLRRSNKEGRKREGRDGRCVARRER